MAVAGGGWRVHWGCSGQAPHLTFYFVFFTTITLLSSCLLLQVELRKQTFNLCGQRLLCHEECYFCLISRLTVLTSAKVTPCSHCIAPPPPYNNSEICPFCQHAHLVEFFFCSAQTKQTDQSDPGLLIIWKHISYVMQLQSCSLKVKQKHVLHQEEKSLCCLSHIAPWENTTL